MYENFGVQLKTKFVTVNKKVGKGICKHMYKPTITTFILSFGWVTRQMLIQFIKSKIAKPSYRMGHTLLDLMGTVRCREVDVSRHNVFWKCDICNVVCKPVKDCSFVSMIFNIRVLHLSIYTLNWWNAGWIVPFPNLIPGSHHNFCPDIILSQKNHVLPPPFHKVWFPLTVQRPI